MSTVSEVAPLVYRRTSVRESTFDAYAGIGLALVAVAYGPFLYVHGTNLLSKSHYEFFPLVLLLSGFLAWSASKRLGPLQAGRYKFITAGGALLALGLLLGAAFFGSATLAVGSFMLGLLVFLYSYGGWTLTKRMLPAWIFLWLAVPPPLNLDVRLIQWLQIVTTRWSSYFLDLFGVLHVMSGNIIEVPNKHLGVEQACSGINSLFALLTVALFLIFWSRRSIIHGILLLAGAVGFVLVGNLLRVWIIALAYNRRQIDLSEGWKHEALGFAIFIVMFVLVLSLDRLLLFLIATVNAIVLWRRTAMTRHLQAKLEQNRPTDLGATRWPRLTTAWMFAKPAMAVFALIAVFNVALLAMGINDATPLSADKMLATFGQLDGRFFSPGIAGWELVGFEPQKRKNGDIHGDYSRDWKFKKGSSQADISLDYAWTAFHDLQVCYDGTGWTILNRNNVPGPDPAPGVPDHVIEISMSKPLGHEGYLLFTEYEADGLPTALPDNSIRKRLTQFGFRPKRKLLVYQVQIFTVAFTPPSEEKKKEFRQLYDACRERIAQIAPHRGEVQR